MFGENICFIDSLLKAQFCDIKSEICLLNIILKNIKKKKAVSKTKKHRDNF